MMLLGPMIGAFAGAWFQLHEHPEVIRHGVVVSIPSVGEVAAGIAVGTLLGIGGAFLLAFTWAAVRYRLWGDKVWQATHLSSDREMVFDLRNRRKDMPADPSHLGAVECLLKTPAGEIIDYDGRLEPRRNPYGLIARFPIEPEPGVYEARWSVAREGQRLHEVARVKTVWPEQ
jgi:hypothetical protein